MKLDFFKSVGRMGRESLPLLICLMLSPSLASGVDASHNTGTIAYYSGLYADTVSYPPNVDSVNFYNSGIWDIFTAVPLADYALGVQLPYATANTLTFTNWGTMRGSVGWEFDHGQTTTGTRNLNGRGMAGIFFNAGTIESVNGNILPLANSEYPSLASFLTISATNVFNWGNLIGGVAGNIAINGVNVDLGGGVVEIAPDGCIPSQCSYNNFTQTNFTADTAIYDEWWGTNSLNLDSSTLWNGVGVTTPYFLVNAPCQTFNAVIPPNTVFPTLADSITNVGVYTNIITTNMDGVTWVTNHEPVKIFKQAVFVGTGDYRITPADRFYDVNSQYGGNRSNRFQTITVKLTSYSGCTLYLVDTLGSSTNDEFLRNATVLPGSDPQHPYCDDTTFRPGNYILERTDCQNDFANGIPGLGWPDTNFFYDASYSNAVAPAKYSAYSGYVDDVVRTQSPIAANTLTNSPGRIVVTASNLDLTYATLISGGTEISLKAHNFIGSSHAQIQCRNVSYNLGSTNGNLNVVNLITNTPVPGLHGYVDAWSAVWTNRMITGVFTNYYYVTNSSSTSTNSTTTATPTNNVITNLAEVDFHVLVVNAQNLLPTENETVEDLILHSTNMVVNDSANVRNHLLFNGTSLTLNGSLGLSVQNLPNWDSSIAPSLLYFTNNGSLTVPQDAHFGDDTPTSYAAFVNHGAISVGGGEMIDSTYYQDEGTSTAPGGYSVTTVTGKVENASITSGASVNFSGGALKLDHSTLYAGNELNFNLTNALYDSGGSADNTLICGDGFNLPIKPAVGDLLGTTISCNANLLRVHSVWAGTDYGAATTAGYTNNEAVGQLILSPDGSSSFPTTFYFSGAGSGNALYVDMLDLSQISSNNLSAALQMNNMTIYYAAAKLSFTPPPLNGVSQEPEEYLNGLFNGHLRWVTNFAGPNSSVDVIINGQTYAVNRALRYSKIIDSNGNGVPNYYDTHPFNTPPSGSVPQLTLAVSLVPQPGQSSTNAAQTLQSVESAPPTVVLSWVADPNAVYQVQYRTNLPSGVWQPLLNYTNTASTNVNVKVWDTNAVAGQRFYRLSRP